MNVFLVLTFWIVLDKGPLNKLLLLLLLIVIFLSLVLYFPLCLLAMD